MKHNLFALGLIAILSGLAAPPSGVTQNSSAFYTVNVGRQGRRDHRA